MNDAISNQAQDHPRPPGLVGLVVSLLAITLIGLLALALAMSVIALADYLLFGWPHLRDSIKDGLAMTQGDRMDDVITAGLFIGCAIYIAGIFGLWAMARIRAGRAWPQLLGWTPFRVDRTFWTLLAAGVAYQLGASLVVAWLHPASRQWLSLPDSPLGLALAFALIVVLAPVAEELLFRGWIYTALRWRFGFTAALWATAIIFALAHWDPTHLYALAILPIGLALGYLRERTGSARATTLFHMLYNFAGLGLSFLGKL